MKIYFVRHQAGGVLWEYPFAPPPNAAQLAAVTAIAESRHGAKHPKTGKPYWVHVVAVESYEAGEMPPAAEARDDSAPSVARIGLPDVQLSGSATVKNPG